MSAAQVQVASAHAKTHVSTGHTHVSSHHHGHSIWSRWYKKPKCHTHHKPKPHLHSTKYWWHWRVFRHLRKHWRGSEHCDETPSNQLPSALISSVVSVSALDTVTLDGSASSDSDGTIASYLWSQTGGIAVTLDNAGTDMASFTAPVLTTADTLTFELTVTDNDGGSNTQSIDIELIAAIAPTVSITGGGTYQIDSDPLTPEIIFLESQVTDSDSSSFMYEWVQFDNGSPVVNIVTPDQAQTDIELPEVNATTSLLFDLTVIDNTALTVVERVEVIVEPSPVTTSSITGFVSDINGVAIPGVELTVLDNQADTGLGSFSMMDGGFELTNLEASTDYVIQFSLEGYASQVLVATSPNAGSDASFGVVMIEVGDTINVPASLTGFNEFYGPDGAAVNFDRADFIYEDTGLTVVGDFDVEITPVNISQFNSSFAFPGLFAGIPSAGGDPVSIASLGTVNFNFTQNGQALNLAPGAMADVLIPIYTTTNPADGSILAEGDVIPLWSLDETTGIWVQEGEGEVFDYPDSPTGLAFAATVSHFSWWNCDVTIDTAKVEVTVPGSAAGTAVISGSAVLGASNWRPSTVSTTIEIGGTTRPLDIPANREVCFVADVTYDAGGSDRTIEKCITASTGSDVQLLLEFPEPGPLDLMVRPTGGEDSAQVQVLSGFNTLVAISPLTDEAFVFYEIIGDLPSGLSLDVIDNQSAKLVGTADEIGVFDFVVRGQDLDGFTDDINIVYTVLDPSLAPPILADSGFTSLDGLGNNLNDIMGNVGGEVTLWESVVADGFSADPDERACFNNNWNGDIGDPQEFPPSVQINSQTGEISSRTFNFTFWDGCIKASNSNGVSMGRFSIFSSALE